MRPTGRRSSPPVAAALALLLLLVLFFFSHCASAARPLPASAAAELVLQDGATGNGDEVSELMGAAEEEAAGLCKEGNEECVERRMLRDAHLDYIYTQKRNRP
ncbi:hypothetical protein OsI_37465 [Oryza sativa Indica Group]|uniref:Phytosulfokine n=1 Tax=Oryza sativa subsp. indica TaxID=39946 RepID=A2ZI25_ORYSI|nr:hypothetical protein OsI_37465 [Oryza sativa Indica Group]